MSAGVARFRTDDTSYSDRVLVAGPGSWLYVAGQLAFDADRHLIEGDVSAQTHLCLDRISDLVVGAGGNGLEDVVSITVYLLRLEDYPAFNEVRSERFGDHRPASAAVQVNGLLFDALIEISAVAFVAAQR